MRGVMDVGVNMKQTFDRLIVTSWSPYPPGSFSQEVEEIIVAGRDRYLKMLADGQVRFKPNDGKEYGAFMQSELTKIENNA